MGRTLPRRYTSENPSRHDILSGQVWKRLAPGGVPGLQTRWGAFNVPGEFDSHSLPPVSCRFQLKGETTMTRLAFHFDFGSPNAYLSHLVIPEIEKRIGARFEYVPVLLGGLFKATNNRSPMESMAGIKNKPDYERLEMRRFIARHQIMKFQFNSFFPVNTLAIMRGAVAARHLGVLEKYVDEVYRYMWAEGRNMGDPAVIAASLEESGLPVKALLDASASPEIKAELISNTDASVAHGSFGSPTFFVDDDIYFGKDRLRDVEEAFLSKRG